MLQATPGARSEIAKGHMFGRPQGGLSFIVGQNKRIMGAALYIVAKDKPEEMDLFVNGKAVSNADDRLSSAAKELGVRELMSFFSQSPEDLPVFVDDVSALPSEQWFDPVDGLATVTALISHFSQSPGDSAVVEDLREFEKVLQQLKDAGLRWHLAVDF